MSKIGVPKECKNHEYRVGLTPAIVDMLTHAGHHVYVQTDAGRRSGFSDEMYTQAGAEIVPSPKEVYASDIIIKVKEPQKQEYPLLRQDQVLFCFLHLAAEPTLLAHLVERGVSAIAFETITDHCGGLPILTPMSEVAGRIAIQAGATALQMNFGGKGVLLGGVPGVSPGKVVIIGGGVVGTQAAKMALGLGADVTILEKKLERLRQLDDLWGPRLKTLYSSPQNVANAVKQADLLIGAVLIPGKKAPKLVSENMIKSMSVGSVFVDVAIDQGGCSETSRPTSHAEPIYEEYGVTHYCVTNMPAACAKTSTEALSNAVAPWAFDLVNKGFVRAMRENPHFAAGLNIYNGKVTNQAVAEDCGFAYCPKESCF